jgi:hypothetical protein
VLLAGLAATSSAEIAKVDFDPYVDRSEITASRCGSIFGTPASQCERTARDDASRGLVRWLSWDPFEWRYPVEIVTASRRGGRLHDAAEIDQQT